MCATCHWEVALIRIESMQLSGNYDWAADMLSNLHDEIQGKEHMTDIQDYAIDNIEDSNDRD